MLENQSYVSEEQMEKDGEFIEYRLNCPKCGEDRAASESEIQLISICKCGGEMVAEEVRKLGFFTMRSRAEASRSKTMTTKELAEFLGKSEDTILRQAKALGYGEGQGKSFKFERGKVEMIAERIFKKVPFAVKESIKLTFDTSAKAGSEPPANAEVQRGMELVFGAIGKLAKRIDVLEEKVESVPQIGYDETHMTVLGFCNVNGIDCSMYDASRAGKEAARLSREEGVDIRTVPDDRFGKVNSYHKAILSKVFAL